MTRKQTRVGVIGSGAWGTALAVLANRAGSKTTLWTRNQTVFDSIEDNRENEAYLPDVFIDPAITTTMQLQDIVKCDMIILCVPSQSLRTMCISLSDMLDASVPLILACKGIERGSLALMSEVVNAILPSNPVAIISGPNFAGEAAQGLPTATTLACTDTVLGEQISYAIGGRMFRPYQTDDLVGVQIGGAVKNVVAIACGIAAGKGFGENARAALITRGIAEISRLAKVKGGRMNTLMGLSGMGDLMLTCSSMQSRNMSLGYALGQGKTIDEALPGRMHGLTEGVSTADSVNEMAMKLGVSMPISVVVHDIMRGAISVDDGITELLGRPFSTEECAA